MSVKSVSLEQFKRLAGDLRCEPEALMAVSKVEAPKGAFTPDGHPTILFERHVFYKNARRDKRDEWHRLYPTICNPTRTPRGGYGTEARIREKYEFAFKLDPHAAMMACSWGAFQELGANYDDYGFHNVEEFVAMMKSGIEGQLEIFVRSIRHRGLADELRRLDWRGFARNYNGAGYAEFGYHIHMGDAYDAAKARKINWATISIAPRFDDDDVLQLTESIGPSSTDTEPAGSKAAYQNEPANTVEKPEPEAVADPGAVTGDGQTVQNAETIVNNVPAGSIVDKASALGDKVQNYQGILEKFGISNPLANTSIGTWIMTIGKVLFGGVSLAFGLIEDHWEFLLIAAFLFAIAAWLYNESRKRVEREKAGLPVSLLQQLPK